MTINFSDFQNKSTKKGPILANISLHICGYIKGYRKQHALISMMEKWRKKFYEKGTQEQF